MLTLFNPEILDSSKHEVGRQDIGKSAGDNRITLGNFNVCRYISEGTIGMAPIPFHTMVPI